MSKNSLAGLNGPTICQLVELFHNTDLLAEFLMKLGGWNVIIPKHKPRLDRRSSLGQFSIYRHVPEHIADYFREHWPGHRCPIPTGRHFLISYLISCGKSNREIVQIMRVSRATVLKHKQQYRRQRLASLPR